jgi:hypothetical protein
MIKIHQLLLQTFLRASRSHTGPRSQILLRVYHFFGILTVTGEQLERKEAYRTHQNRAIDVF